MTEWWQRGPIEGIPAVLQPVAHILLQVRESVGELVEPLTESQWNARPGGVASAAFHVRHMAGVIDRLFTYARGRALSSEQLAAIQTEGAELRAADVAALLGVLSARVDAAVAELRTIDVATLGDFRGVGRAQLPSTVIGCLVHGAEHAMRHVGQLSVTARVVRSGLREGPARNLASISPFFIVKDLQASIAFYVERLGFQLEFQGPPGDVYYAGVTRDGVGIMLKTILPDVLPQPNHTRHEWARWDAYIYTLDPDTLFEEFRQRGVSFVKELSFIDDGLWGFELADADGYVLAFFRLRNNEYDTLYHKDVSRANPDKMAIMNVTDFVRPRA